MEPDQEAEETQNPIETGGGSVVQGDVNTGGGDFVGRDKLEVTVNQGRKDPAPLSDVPRTARPLLEQAMVGREPNLEWLHTTKGDRLLVGQPGVGKTFLLYRVAAEGNALFVVSQDRGEIAAALQEHSPSVLIVDDAQLYYQLLLNLKHLRTTTGVEFSILASCWPGDEGTVAEYLGISSSQIHRLDRLTRDQIVEVIKGAELHGPNRLIQEIVDQAEGRPGLAVTLSRLCLEGGVREVVYGDQLNDFTVRFYEQFVGSEVRPILAAFSIGGDGGLPIDVVAHSLDMRLSELREALVRLAAGGVLLEVDERCLSVRPPTLRYVLIRDVFFSGALSLPFAPPLLAHASPQHAAQSLIGARSRGAVIPDDVLLPIMHWGSSNDVWRMYASLGRSEAKQVLAKFPESATSFAEVYLHHIPAETLPLLLQASVGDDRPLHAHPDHPLRIVQDWIYSGHPGTPEALERRHLLFRCTRSWLLDGNELGTALRAFKIALSPEFRHVSTDPGSGMTVTIRTGSLTRQEMEALQDLWGQLWEILRTVRISDWSPIWEAIEIWAFPSRVSPQLPDAEYAYMRECASDLLKTAVTFVQEQPGFQRRAERIARYLDIDLEIPMDEEFAILYPQMPLKPGRESQVEHREAVSNLALRWAQQAPEQVAQRLKDYEQEAVRAKLGWSAWVSVVCQDISRLVSSPCTWLRVFIENGLSNALVEPFLKRVSEIDEPGWHDLAIRCLHEDKFRQAAVSVILTNPNAPQDLIDESVAHLEDCAHVIKMGCFRNEIPEDRVRLLLNHCDPEIARAAAEGEWNSDPRGSVRPSLSDDWRRVVVQHSLKNYVMQEALVGNAELAQDWLEARLPEYMSLVYWPHEERTAVNVAVDQLHDMGRRQLLERVAEIGEGRYSVFSDLVRVLVAGNLELYRYLLSDGRLQSLHLVPFSESVDTTWTQCAVLALDAGHTVEEIAGAAFPTTWSWSGNESDMWAERAKRFKPLLSHSDERLKQIGRLVRDHALGNQKRALEGERREAVYGI